MMDDNRPYPEIQRVLEKVRDMLMHGTSRLSDYEYYWFCNKYGQTCYQLERLSEADYFLKRAVIVAESMGDMEKIADSVGTLLQVLFAEKRFSEGANIGGKYAVICSGHEGVYDIYEGLCVLYRFLGWNRKAQRLADKILRYRRKTESLYYVSFYSFLYMISFNNGKCKEREFLLSEWYDFECHVNGADSAEAMEVLAEKTVVAVSKDEIKATEANLLLDKIIPVLEKGGCRYSIVNLQNLIAFQALQKNIAEEKELALGLFEKAKILQSDSDSSDGEYLEYIGGLMSEIETLRAEETANIAERGE